MGQLEIRAEIKRAKRVLLGVFLFLVLDILSMCATKYYDLKLTVRVIAREFLGEKNFRIESQSIDVIGISDYGQWHLVLSNNVDLAKIEEKLFKGGFRPPSENKGLKCYYNGDLWLERGSCPAESRNRGSPCWVTICLKDGDKNVFIDVSAE
ncbi:MAG: hypothetical protein H6858_08870 [Rhodospirillales bacterium]|nr:hypothetical protein [Alphaproteobacteria bacterium]MCB9977695.1 hypothetical protein [Rhodospirillales bacterium]